MNVGRVWVRSSSPSRRFMRARRGATCAIPTATSSRWARRPAKPPPKPGATNRSPGFDRRARPPRRDQRQHRRPPVHPTRDLRRTLQPRPPASASAAHRAQSRGSPPRRGCRHRRVIKRAASQMAQNAGIVADPPDVSPDQERNMTDLARFEELVPLDHGLSVVVTRRANYTPQTSVVNAGVLPHPVTGERVVAFVAVGGARKLAYLRADPTIAIVVRAAGNGLQSKGALS